MDMQKSQIQRPQVQRPQVHRFHIPVMGTGFTIDTPIKVGKYGIHSVVSIVDDVLVEQMRKFWSEKTSRPYTEITKDVEDSRAKRITAYLNLLTDILKEQFTQLQQSPFVPGSEITRYFSLLPDGDLSSTYKKMLSMPEGDAKNNLQSQLRASICPGAIESNIMTKLDRDIYKDGEMLPHKFADAMSALRGFAQSRVKGNIVFSAGLNAKLYSYIPEFEDFFPDENGQCVKRVTLKVSDYRSALVQGRFLAKKGVWISEYRIESGLNCGGHAFATKGFLSGPILEEFRTQRHELIDALWPIYQGALRSGGKVVPQTVMPTIITVQGGIGNYDETHLLLHYYGLDRTGWGTPFLFVPEVTNLDAESMEIVKAATEKESFLSESSPLGVPYWNIRTSLSETKRKNKIEKGRPGSPCPKGFLVSNTEFTERPICTASRAYQVQKLKDLTQKLEEAKFTAAQKKYLEDLALAKSCICHDLSGSATRKHGIDPDAATSLCAGPNVINFNQEFALEQMVDHIYGRGPSVVSNTSRPHMFLREAELYLDYYERETLKVDLGLSANKKDYFVEFIENFKSGLIYYRTLITHLKPAERDSFQSLLNKLEQRAEKLELPKNLVA